MRLEDFTASKISVWHTGIRPGQWFVEAPSNYPCRVFKCAEIIIDGISKTVITEPFMCLRRGWLKTLKLHAFDCYVLDASYTEAEILGLQNIALRESEDWQDDKNERIRKYYADLTKGKK
jgi:hypothetical protein